MEYTTEFKQRCLKTFLGRDKVHSLMSSMEANNHTTVRQCLEDLSDITQYDLLEPVFTNREATSHNDQISLYREARKLYTEYMEQLIQEIDKECQTKVQELR